MFKDGSGFLNCWLMMRLALGSNKKLVYMLMHIIGVGLKGSNFQEWPKSFPVSGIA